MKKIFTLFATCLILLTSCSENHQPTKHPQDTLRIDVGSEVPTLDPQLQTDTSSARVSYDLFSGLVDFDQQNNIIPGMAESWEIAPNGKAITFHLRKNLKFSDGSPITANDFMYSWIRLVDPKTASGYNYLLDTVVNSHAIIAGKFPPDSLGVSAPDNDTFIVYFDHPDNTFLQKCAMPNLAVVPEKVIKQYGNHWTDAGKMVTSGAYILKEHVLNGYILAEKNPYYYDANSVHIPKVKYFPYEDTNASIASYESGGLDMTFDSVPIDRFQELKREFPTQLHNVKEEAFYYYDFNMMLPEFKDNIKLRQALSMAIDREVISKYILQSSPAPLYSVVTPTIANGRYADLTYSWEKEPREQQIAEAKKLYQEAGYSEDHPLKVSISFNTSDGHQKLALGIAAMWKKVLGVETTIQNQEWKTFIDARKKGDYMIARDGWVADYNSVKTYLILYQCHNKQNNSHYCNPEYDKLLALGNNTINPKEQENYYHQALQIALNDYAIIPINQYNYQRLVQPYVQGYDIDHNYLNHVQSKWMRFSSSK